VENSYLLEFPAVTEKYIPWDVATSNTSSGLEERTGGGLKKAETGTKMHATNALVGRPR
jgi:hypothetical protein